MKTRIESNGFTLTPELEKYTSVKLADLMKRLPHKLRPDISCQVVFTQKQQAGKKFSTCALGCVLAGESFMAQETTQHMYAALDIAAVHMEHQLQAYISRHEQRLAARLRRHISADWQPPAS